MAAPLNSSLFGIMRKMSLMSLSSHNNIYRSLYTNVHPSLIQASSVLCAEPLKRRKRIDPGIVKMREDRKRRRIEKSIRKLKKLGRKLKPIDEFEIHPALKKDKHNRIRLLEPIGEEEEERRYFIRRTWAKYRMQTDLDECAMIERMIVAQERALEALKEESEELYLEAIQIDSSVLPHAVDGPVLTPPIPDYVSPDGDYEDVTKLFNKKII